MRSCPPYPMRQFKHGASSQRQHYSFSPEWPEDATGDLPAPLLESPDSQIGHELVLYQVDLLLICSPRFILFYLIFFRLFVSFLFLPSSSSPRLSLSLSLSLSFLFPSPSLDLQSLPFQRDGSSDIPLSS